MFEYDFLIVGAGLFGAVCAYELSNAGYKVMVLEKRNKIGGILRCETDPETGITIHEHGPHIFHTDSREIWDYINQFDKMIPYNPEVIAYSQNNQYNVPFNLNTLFQIYGTTNPEICKKMINNDSINYINPDDVESYCLSKFGVRFYKLLIKDYVEKIFRNPCRELPKSLVEDLDLRNTYDNRYYSDRYSGVPSTSYNTIIEKMLSDSDVYTCVDFDKSKNYWMRQAKTTIYTGRIDRFYDYKLGRLEYRSLRFEKEYHNTPNMQGRGISHYVDNKCQWTRIAEYKHFKNTPSKKTILVKEFPEDYTGENEPYYPVNNPKNISLYQKYLLLNTNPNLIFTGRLGLYQYLNMDKTVESALFLSRKLINGA